MAARQRLRKATQESLAIPAFSSPLDCTPWVIGGLWPAELSTATAETTTLADYLRADLQRIASCGKRRSERDRPSGKDVSGAAAPQRLRVIDEARALAARRVESTIRQVRQMTAATRCAEHPRPHMPCGQPADRQRPRRIWTRPRSFRPSGRRRPRWLWTRRKSFRPCGTRRHRWMREDQSTARRLAGETADSKTRRLQRLLAFVVRQEPRLNWAVGDHAGRHDTLVTDLAHGWIPPGIALPAGVRLLEPGRRGGESLGAGSATATRMRPTTPGDSS